MILQESTNFTQFSIPQSEEEEEEEEEMPSLSVILYSIFFKLYKKHQLYSLTQKQSNPFGTISRSDESVTASNPTFIDGVATKDIHIDPHSALSVRIFLPDTVLISSSADGHIYKGYSPPVGTKSYKKLPIMLQFHGGGFVSGSNDSAPNDAFCRRIAKLCDVIVVAVGYRLAPESRFPASFEDGLKVLNWLKKQANLAQFGGKNGKVEKHVFDGFGVSMVEPWLAAHADPSRCVLLGVSCGGNIANYVARKAIEAGSLLDPVKVVAQVLMYPFFIGSVPTKSEINLANSYIYDKAMCLSAWKLFLPEEDFNLDHPAANPLVSRRELPLRFMPPTLTIVAEHDCMRDRAIAYSKELRKVNVDAPVLDYKDTVHDFATLDILLQTPQARACAEDMALWVKKYISIRGHEYSY